MMLGILFFMLLVAGAADMNLENILRAMLAVGIITWPIWAMFGHAGGCP